MATPDEEEVREGWFSRYFPGLHRHWQMVQGALELEKPSAGERRGDELAFLPAVLEVTDTPASPLGRKVIFFIVGIFVFFLAWSILGKVDVFATANGKIVAQGGIKVIQPLETGIVRRIRVQREGAAVVRGEILMELDPTESMADNERLQRELAEARMEEARLIALCRSGGLDLGPQGTPAADDGVARHAGGMALAVSLSKDGAALPLAGLPDTDREGSLGSLVGAGEPLDFFSPEDPSSSLARLHRALLLKEWGSYRSKMDSIEGEILQQRAARASVVAELPILSRRMDNLRQRAAMRKTLLEQGKGTQLAWFEADAEYQEVAAEQMAKSHRVQELDAAVESLWRRARETREGFFHDALGRLAEARRKADSLDQEIKKAVERQERNLLRAPEDGTVHRIAVHTEGGVVTPAQELMFVVPKKTELEVEAMLLGKDRGFVKIGQPVEIKLETFPFTKYGVIEGEVRHLSDDAVEHEQMGLVFPVRVTMKQRLIRTEGDRWVRLTPGMAVTAEVKLDDRRVIEYLLNPILKGLSESLTER